MSGTKGRSGRKKKPPLKAVAGTDIQEGDGGENETSPPKQRKAQAPSPPSFLNPVARREWRRLARELADQGLLTKIDRAQFALYCQTYGRLIEAEDKMKLTGLVVKTKNGFPIQSPYLPIIHKSVEIMNKLAIEFGMTPASRSRVPGSKEDEREADPFAEFFVAAE
jgi:P27 family predicted phage terminase small subunit